MLVSGAAATGSVVGQIAKLKGCRTIGIAGGEKKCAWLNDVAKFDGAIDYKSEDVSERIGALCPDKWDVFFDNVARPILEAALNHLNLYSRVVMCGGIANYNNIEPEPGPNNLMNIVTNRGRMQGFIILDYLPRAMEAIEALVDWVTAGDIVYEVDVQEGFDNIPKTLQRLYTGENFGKQLLRSKSMSDPQYKTLFQTVCEAPIKAPLEAFNLHNWVFTLSDKDYQTTARGYIGAGSSIHTDGTQTSVNVESVGGNLLVQHYVAEVKQPDYVKMVSFSDLWLMKLVHVVVKVTWEMRLISVSEGECKFQNTVLVEHPHFIMKILSALALGGFFVRKHNEEETPLFAQNLYERTFKAKPD